MSRLRGTIARFATAAERTVDFDLSGTGRSQGWGQAG
jgi:hypothetical protein